MWQVLYEGEQVSLFGMLTYDTTTGQASIDESVAMMASGAKDAIKDVLNSEYYQECLQMGIKTLLLMTCCYGLGVCVRKAYARYREIRLDAD